MIVQPGGVYGPGDPSQLADLLDQFLTGKMPLIPFPELGICLAHVEDIAGGIVLALDKGEAGRDLRARRPADDDARGDRDRSPASAARRPRSGPCPTVLMKAMTPIGPLVGKMMGQPPNLRELISSADGVTFWATNEKAVRELGFDPRGIEEGLRQTLEEDDRFPSPAPA